MFLEEYSDDIGLGSLESPLPMPVTQNSPIISSVFIPLAFIPLAWKVLVVTTIKPSFEFQESSTNFFFFLKTYAYKAYCIE